MLRKAVPIFFLLFISAAASADIYKYTDENGVICYTDAPFGKKTEKVLAQKNANAEVKKTVVSGDYNPYVQKAARKYEIEPELIHAVIRTESNGNHRAISKKGAMGLMQLMPSTASDLNVGNPFNPEENIDGGTKYLRFLLEKFNGNLTLALAAYNSGPKTVEKYGSVPPISETRQYVNKVFSYYNGKKHYARSGATGNYQERSEPIYKVVLEDGTILFTNSTLVTKGKIRF
ncbi:MAG: lytic transglycosylase domain-containing protein [Nitrospirota bacterium]|nr:lytic transglycosylase domain-containing protein [Nitrospirota bacterium]